MPNIKRHPWPTRRNPETGRSEILFAGTWMPRQRAWQLAQVLRGHCGRCGKPRGRGRQDVTLCADCWQRQKERAVRKDAA